MTSGIDEGEIILQGKFEIAENETPETLAQKVHQIEYEIFPKAIDLVLKKSSIGTTDFKNWNSFQ